VRYQIFYITLQYKNLL